MISVPPVTGPAWVLAKYSGLGRRALRLTCLWSRRRAPLRSLARSDRRKDAPMNSCRHHSVGPAVDLLRPVALPPVLAGPLAGQNGDDRPDRLLGVGLGDRHRQNSAVPPHSKVRRRLRAGLLVGPVARGALHVARGQTGPLDRRAVRRRHARMEKELRGSCPLVRRAANAHRKSDGCRYRARGRAHGAQASGAGDGRLGRARSSACSARFGAS